jgi:hypothetical protein
VCLLPQQYPKQQQLVSILIYSGERFCVPAPFYLGRKVAVAVAVAMRVLAGLSM